MASNRILAICKIVLIIYSVSPHCDHLAWGRESWSMCFSCICSFCTRWCLFVFSSSRCRGLTAAYDCGSPWMFMNILLNDGPLRENSITWRATFMTSLSLHISSWWRRTSTRLNMSEPFPTFQDSICQSRFRLFQLSICQSRVRLSKTQYVRAVSDFPRLNMSEPFPTFQDSICQSRFRLSKTQYVRAVSDTLKFFRNNNIMCRNRPQDEYFQIWHNKDNNLYTRGSWYNGLSEWTAVKA